MAYREFDGELDEAPPTGKLKEFTGELDPPQVSGDAG